MKIIKFPTKNQRKQASTLLMSPSVSSKDKEDVKDTCDDTFNDSAEIIDISAFAGLDFEAEMPRVDLEKEAGFTDTGFFERIVDAAKGICADESDMAAAICAMVDELSKKTEPLKEKFFLPEKVFFKMVGNDHYEEKFSKLISRFPSMHEYKDLSLSQVAVMLEKNWPFKAAEKELIGFVLHLFGAYRKIDLLKLKAYVSENDWLIAVAILENEEL